MEYFNYVLIDQNRLINNYHSFQQKFPNASIVPFLKSNAYGHDIRKIARVLNPLAPPLFIVDSLEEAIQLTDVNITQPILILGFLNHKKLELKKYPYQFAVSHIDTARHLNKFQPGAKIHLFFDTGMSREGISLADVPCFLEELKKLTYIHVEGVLTHLSDIDNPEPSHSARSQIKKFKQIIKLVNHFGFSPKWKHISASAGAFKIGDTDFNLIRLGISLYGINPLESTDPSLNTIKIEPVLQLNSTVTLTKTISKGCTIGYNDTFIASKDMVLGLIPCGYYHGIDRRLSNSGFVKINDTFCPIVGKISMNMTVVDISEIKDIKVGDPVVVYSSNPNDLNSIEMVARNLNTIPHTLLLGIPECVPRILI